MITPTVPDDLWQQLKTVVQEQRHEPTLAERELWAHLRDHRMRGIKFRRQHAVYRFILDFASLRPKLCIEVDGSIHETTQEYDALRTEYLNLMGFEVIRFTNEQIFDQLPQVLSAIDTKITEILASLAMKSGEH